MMNDAMKGLQCLKMIKALCSLSKYKLYYIDSLYFVNIKLVVNATMKKLRWRDSQRPVPKINLKRICQLDLIQLLDNKRSIN